MTALIRNGNLVVSNIGDCRAVISRGGAAEALTSDHRPSREDERERIENLVRSLANHPCGSFSVHIGKLMFCCEFLFCRVAMLIFAMACGEFRGLWLYQEASGIVI